VPSAAHNATPLFIALPPWRGPLLSLGSAVAGPAPARRCGGVGVRVSLDAAPAFCAPRPRRAPRLPATMARSRRRLPSGGAMLSIVACSFLFKTGDGDHRAPRRGGKSEGIERSRQMASGRSSASSRWAPPCCAPGRPRRAQPGNRRGRPPPVMHTTHATAAWRRGEKGGQQTVAAPFRDEHRTRPLTNLLPELRPALLPGPLTRLLLENPASYLGPGLLPEPGTDLLPGA